MTLQSNGAISFSDIQTELGGFNPINITEYYSTAGNRIPTSIPASGMISASDFYGKRLLPTDSDLMDAIVANKSRLFSNIYASGFESDFNRQNADYVNRYSTAVYSDVYCNYSDLENTAFGASEWTTIVLINHAGGTIYYPQSVYLNDTAVSLTSVANAGSGNWAINYGYAKIKPSNITRIRATYPKNSQNTTNEQEFFLLPGKWETRGYSSGSVSVAANDIAFGKTLRALDGNSSGTYSVSAPSGSSSLMYRNIWWYRSVKTIVYRIGSSGSFSVYESPDGTTAQPYGSTAFYNIET